MGELVCYHLLNKQPRHMQRHLSSNIYIYVILFDAYEHAAFISTKREMEGINGCQNDGTHKDKAVPARPVDMLM